MALSELPPPPPPQGLKAIVRLQAYARGRRARRHYKILRWYHGLDKSPCPKTPGNRSTVSASKDIGKAPNRMNGPKTAKSASPKEPSRPISSTAPPTCIPESSGAFRAPTEKSPPIMAPIEDFLDPEDSEKAKKYAATAKKVLLLRTTDYVAYLNALLKAHAVEDILSESKGIDAILNELLCFLAVKALGKSPVPSMRIHRAWCLLVLTRPLAYIEMCKAMDASSGFAINDENFDPNPEGDEDDSLDTILSNTTKERYECTRITYAALFQSSPPSEFWPPTSGGGGVVERGEVPGNHLEFLNEENLPRDEDLFSEFEIGSDTYTFVSSFDDDSLGSLGPSALLNELGHLAKEQNIDISNLSYDSIVNRFQWMHLWVDNTFFKQDAHASSRAT